MLTVIMLMAATLRGSTRLEKQNQDVLAQASSSTGFSGFDLQSKCAGKVARVSLLVLRRPCDYLGKMPVFSAIALFAKPVFRQ
jgi:hypothetical protein